MDTRNLYLPTEEELAKALELRDAASTMCDWAALDDANRQGCYISILNPQGDLVLMSRLGLIGEAKEAKYVYFSREKPTRICAHNGHITSGESWLVDAERSIFQYDGGVRFLVTTPWLGWSIGTSGFREEIDLGVSLGAGIIVGATTPDFIDKVVAIRPGTHPKIGDAIDHADRFRIR